MSFHRLLERRETGGRLREAGSLIDYRGPPVPWFEPLEVGEHSTWIGAMRREASPRDESRSAIWPRPRRRSPREGLGARKPLIGVLCCNEMADRPIQAVASRFIEPLVRLSGATVLLVPALIDTFDAESMADHLDGLLLTGARSDVAPSRYGGIADEAGALDEERDEVALALAGRMIEIGRPVFGICRGLQELNVLFGGTLQDTGGDAHHPHGEDTPYEHLFHHRHEIELTAGGRFAHAAENRRIKVNSVHRQGINRLGGGLAVEALAHDGLVEAFSGPACGADVLAVQWHPEWNTAECPASMAFFTAIGGALRVQGETRQ